MQVLLLIGGVLVLAGLTVFVALVLSFPIDRIDARELEGDLEFRAGHRRAVR